MTLSRLLVLALSILMVSCAPTNGENAARGPKRQQNVLTQEEIREANYSNVYDAVAALRPNWLRSRGPVSFYEPDAGQVVVVMYNALLGGVDYLRRLNVTEVISLQFLSASEAGARFGFDTSSGPAIVIDTSPEN